MKTIDDTASGEATAEKPLTNNLNAIGELVERYGIDRVKQIVDRIDVEYKAGLYDESASAHSPNEPRSAPGPAKAGSVT
jgi:hypothetical protein